MVPYLRQWFRIYNQNHNLQDIFPDWYFGLIGRFGLRKIEKLRRCRFPHLERYLRRLAPRPLLMIHGEADSYIRAEMALTLFNRARPPSEFWLVKDAKHNHALLINGEEYRARVLHFFEQHLAAPVESEIRGQNGEVRLGHGQRSEVRRGGGQKLSLTSDL
jgi:pimeloyl-ACP methyl ester carboxylesterase